MPRFPAFLAGAFLLVACGEERAEQGSSEPESSGGITNTAVEEVASLPIAEELSCRDDEQLRRDANGNLTSCFLEKSVSFGPYRCAGESTAYFYPGRRLKECDLDRATVLHGVPCKEEFALRETGEIRRCKTTEPVLKQGIAIPANSWLSFDKTGGLRQLEVEASVDIQGFPCKGKFNMFHPTGKLQKCRLASPKRVSGILFATDQDICFDAAGARVDC